MKANVKFFAALFALVFFAASAYAQQPARRNSDDSKRQAVKVERQQSKVDKKQKPTNISNQNATDKKVRDARDNGFGAGNRPDGNRPSGNGGFDGNRPDGNFGNGNRPPMPPQGFRDDYAKRPSVAPRIDYSTKQIYERTNASSIVVNTNFRTKEEAYDYIMWMLAEKAYAVNSYGNNYNWILSDVAFIPTPFDWTNPMTHNQFKVKFYISKSAGAIKVTITGEWRESFLSDSFYKLRFQPSDKYSTYYAWNVLEDFANSIPHRFIMYKR